MQTATKQARVSWIPLALFLAVFCIGLLYVVVAGLR